MQGGEVFSLLCTWVRYYVTAAPGSITSFCNDGILNPAESHAHSLSVYLQVSAQRGVAAILTLFVGCRDRALVPTVHMANTVGKRSSSKYKVGQEVTGRILEVDAAKKRVSMTLKKLLCSDKLPVIATFKVSLLIQHWLSL